MLSLPEATRTAYVASGEPDRWESIVINRRKPHTDRAILYVGESRICLHRFSPCDVSESFAHPHPWPSSMLILAGDYDMHVAHTPNLESDEPSPVVELTLGPGSIYHMHDRHTWHRVVPRSECFSLMVNGPRWEHPHRLAPSTKGKGLETMTEDALAAHLAQCRELLKPYVG